MNQQVIDTFWRTAVERQNIFFNKINGITPLTTDPIFLEYKFCNVYRAADRVTQYLIKEVIYKDKVDEKELLFKIFLFRLINKVETWGKLENVSINKIKEVEEQLSNLKMSGPIYGNAFILCANKVFGYEEKHKNHMALMKYVFWDNKIDLLNSKTLKELFEKLRTLPLIGDFMAYQIAIDMNYSPVFNFDENEFVVPGPGARRGIAKAFGSSSEAEKIIMGMVNNQEQELERRNLKFRNLWGRPMKAIDVQNWWCETDKYCRVKMPELKSNRSKIKTKYKAKGEKINYFFPPKWGIEVK